MDVTVQAIELSADRRRVVVTWADGVASAAPAPWLADNVEDGFDAASGHRLEGPAALDGVLAGVRLDGEALAVRFACGGPERRIPLAALLAAPPAAGPVPDLWMTPDAAPDLARPVDFGAFLAEDAALGQALGQVARLGVVILADAGAQPGTVERAVARFGQVRETNYGRLFDVREAPAAGRLAYTAAALDLHTDNPYRDPPPGLQLLHVIEAAPSGGENRFVDGFAHAMALRAATPQRFARLTTTPVSFAYAAMSGERYVARAPVIELAADGALEGLRVNHRALAHVPLATAEAWYEAYLDLWRRLDGPTASFERRLAPGEIALFDNRRILHARSAYRTASGRWLQGCYAEQDGLKATLARLGGAA